MNRVRQVDIARRLGLSQQAIAFALADEPKPYSIRLRDETRQRIREMARQMGYVPHQAARSLRRGKTDSFLLTTKAELHLPHVHEAIEVVSQVLMEHGKQLLLEVLSPTAPASRISRTVATGCADGLAVLGYEPDLFAELSRTVPTTMPRVMIGPGELPDVPSVTYDRAQATDLAVSHLLDQGHRQVVLIYDTVENFIAQQRLTGYRRALARARVTFNENLLFRAAHDADARALWARIAQAQPEATAIVCYNDQLAVGLLQAIHIEGRRVPDDVALVCAADSRACQQALLPLSAVDTQHRKVAEVAVKSLFEQMKSPEASVRHVQVAPELVVRKTSVKSVGAIH